MIKAYPAGVYYPRECCAGGIEQNWAAFQAIGAKMSPPSTR